MTEVTQVEKLIERLDLLETQLGDEGLTGKVDDSEAEVGLEENLVTDDRSADDRSAPFIRYWHLSANTRGGIKLFRRGIPLRASRLTVYAGDVKYRVHGGSGGTIFTPSGNGGSASSSFKYPGYNRYGVVLVQPGTLVRNITGTSRSSAQTFSISNGRDNIININDRDNDGAYADNWGAFNLYVRVDQS